MKRWELRRGEARLDKAMRYNTKRGKASKGMIVRHDFEMDVLVIDDLMMADLVTDELVTHVHEP